MFSGITNSKEAIRNRMLRTALNYWDIKNTEDLDPIVKLILEALSTELYNLSNDVKDSEVRLLEKIANLLAPEFLTCPNASHGILHAAPVEPEEILNNTTHFYTQRKISSSQGDTLDTNAEVFFTPIDSIKIFDANISILVSGNNLFTYDQSFNKQVMAHTMRGKNADNNTLWLGLKVDEKAATINNLSFCFDWKTLEFKLSRLNYQLLPLSKWYLGDEEIKTTPGMQYIVDSKDTDAAKNIFIDYNLLSMMEKDLKHFYDHKFISITDEKFNKINDLKEEYPSAFKDFFSEADLQKLNEKLLWIKIVFPAALQQESLDEIYVYTNAFPVMNRKLNDLKHRLKGGSNIIPLKTSGLEQFLFIRSVTDESHQYKSTPYRKIEEEETGTYTLRNGGLERFDERNAKELIGYLLELLRSESSAFSVYGYDFITTVLREMEQRIALIEQKIKGLTTTSAEIPHYIIAKPFEGYDLIYAEYWTTLAEAANTIRSGTRLQQYSGSKIKSDSLFLLTTTVGGKNRLKPEERLNAFRYSLITRDRIVTKEDIRNFCFYELGDRISKISVEKGFEMSSHPQQGFIRTIDILLTPVQSRTFDNEEWQILFDQLKSKLSARSGMSNNYRILLSK